MQSKRNRKKLEKNLDFLSCISLLKDVPRTGWKMRGVDNPECVSSHCWMTALMIALLCKRVKKERAIMMALLHDVGTILTLDVAERLSESDQVLLDKEKKKFDDQATRTLISLADDDTAKYLLDIWNDFCAGKSLEARTVHQMEALEMALQAANYERFGRSPISLQELFNHVKWKNLHDKHMFEIISAIETLRKKRFVNNPALWPFIKYSSRVKLAEANIFAKLTKSKK